MRECDSAIWKIPSGVGNRERQVEWRGQERSSRGVIVPREGHQEPALPAIRERNASRSLQVSNLYSATLSNLRYFCSDSTPKRQESLAVLRSSTDFQRYILTVAQQKITLIAQTGKCDGPEGRVKEKVFKYLSSTARLLLFIFEVSSLCSPHSLFHECARFNPILKIATLKS